MPGPVKLFPETLLDGTDYLMLSALVPTREAKSLIQPRLTTLKVCAEKMPLDREGTDIYNNYVLSGYEHVRTEEGTFTKINFTQDFGSDGAGTLVRTFDSSEESFYWPAVLIDVLFGHVEINGTSVGIGTRTQFSHHSIAPQLIQAYHGLTKITVRDYIGMVPFTGITTESLHPTRVAWNMAGFNGSGSVPECLTSGVTVPQVVIDGSSTVISPQRIFDATPQTTWIAHIYSDIVTVQNGLYFRRTKTAAVPPHTPGES